LRAITALHESFARNYGAALSGFMRTIVDVELASVEQLTYSQFILSLPNPTCFALLTAEPLEGSLILEMNPSILFPIIDRLLGGGKTASTVPDRALTNIEFRLAGKIMNIAIEQLQEMWRHVVPTAIFKIAATESNPQLVQIVPPNEPVVLVTFEVSMGETSGMLSLCLPYGVMEPVLADMTKRDWFSYRAKRATPELKDLVERGLKRATVNVAAFLGRTKISVKELLALTVGDIIKTNARVHDEASLVVNDHLKYRGKPGKLRGKRAFLVTRPTEAGEEI
jgi:flagellar motor switch protein FliM